MTEALRHRGPDGAGLHVQGPLGLAMTRLAIIDVAGGQQPIFNEDRTLAMVCNGEIYNHSVLRSQLERSGHIFRTHSDVEVILHLYEEHGANCFSHLNGMFAAAIADFRNNRMILGRDPFGQKPLYIWRGGQQIAFASELKALTRLPSFPNKLSGQALGSFLTFRYVPAPLSIFDDVQKLPPGSYAAIDPSGRCEVRRYWQIDLAENGRSRDRNGCDQMRRQLMEAVDRHLMSERPLGVFLSGGLDSSAIVACMHLAGHRNIHTYTVGFEGFIDNEFHNAAKVAKAFQTSHREVLLSADQFWDSLDAVAYFSDEPLADLTTVPLYHLAQHASREVVVVLSGEGSDELLGGYEGMEDIRRQFDRLRAVRPLAPLARPFLRYPLPDGVRRRLHTLCGSDADYLARNVYSMTMVFDESFKRRHVLGGLVNGDSLQPLSDYYRSRQGWHGANLYLGGLTEWWLPDDLLHKADRMTMAHSVELRCPFLDLELARYCAGLGLDEKVKTSREEPSRKIVLKKAFDEVLPAGIACQRKKGFGIPVYSWLRGVYAGRARAELARADRLGSSLLNRNTREGLLERAVGGDRRSQRQVWSLIILNKWGERWL